MKTKAESLATVERERERVILRKIAFVLVLKDNMMDYQSRDGPSFL